MNSIVKLKENRDFRRAYSRGKSFVSPYLVLYVNKNRTKNIRIGITAGKKIGNAVCRNKAKRLIRAGFQNIDCSITSGYDLVIVARTRILSVKSTVVAYSLEKLLHNAGVAEKNEKNEKNID